MELLLNISTKSEDEFEHTPKTIVAGVVAHVSGSKIKNKHENRVGRIGSFGALYPQNRPEVGVRAKLIEIIVRQMAARVYQSVMWVNSYSLPISRPSTILLAGAGLR
jgi:hypothetical protein